MCPIQETDTAEERWSQAEWQHYELWEKIEARARRVRQLWIFVAIFCFLVLSAVPVLVDRGPQWRALKASRELAQRLAALKREAGERQQSFRLKIAVEKPLVVKLAWGPSCSSPLFYETGPIELISTDSRREQLTWITPARGKELGIPGLLEEFCFDPLQGSYQTPKNGDLAAFMIAPVKELSADRYASVLLSGPSAEISFE